MSDASARLASALADRYRIERELGAGGMATVYLAEDLKHHRQVAVKVLRTELAATLGPQRFLREVETTANLRHPHILPLYDSGEAAGFLFYVMPFVEGESLRDRLMREKQLPVEDALQIAREVADALGYAHGHGVIHRDIKPENILLESGHAVVADFGIARAVSAAAGERLTETGLAIGTVHYMSPEQAAGEQELDGRSDLYALGCVLYEMLAGQPPFTGATPEILVRQHLSVEAPPITNYRPAVPSAVAAALQRALAKAPADRFNRVAQFSEALHQVSTAGSVMPSGASRAFGAAGTAPRSRRAWIVAAGIVVGVLSLLWRARSSAVPVASASVAVLPFVDLSPDRSNAWFGDGMAETLINALTNAPGLSVAARTSAFSFRDRAEDVREIGKQLGVATVLEGSVQRSGDRLRVTAQLIKTADGLHLWSRSFDRNANDIFAVQDEVARAVVTALQGKLVAGADTSALSYGTGNPAAYDAYLLGRYYWNKRTVEDLLRAAGYFQQAIRADSGYAQAWTGLADCYVLFGPSEYAVPGINFDSVLTAAEHAARRAIALAPELGEPHVSLGEILELRGKWEEAREAFRRGIELNPRYATGHQWYGFHLMAWNRWDDAVAELERARELDPMSLVILAGLAMAYDGADRLAEAATVYQRAQELSPEHPVTLIYLFGHDLIRGHLDEAASVYRRWLISEGSDSGRATETERRLRDPALRRSEFHAIVDSFPWYGVLINRTVEGDDATIAFLAHMVKSPRRHELSSITIHGWLGPKLRADPRVQDILVALGYPRPEGGEKSR